MSEYLVRLKYIFVRLRFRLVRLIGHAYATVSATRRDRQKVRDRVTRFFLANEAWYRSAPPRRGASEIASASVLLQDVAFPREVEEAKKLIAVIVPERNMMNGGVHSLFSIAAELRRLKRSHRYEVVVVTRPQPAPITYFRNTNFTNAENVFRFAQLLRCRRLEELLVLLPEYTTRDFVEGLSRRERAHLAGVPRLRINIMNQNINAMPSPDDLADLRTLTGEVTQTIGHHGYFSQAAADRWMLPTLLLPPFVDLSAYPPAPFAEKEKLIIYSLDTAAHKQAVLSAIAQTLPDFELREIRGITFDAFMDLATRCMFSITFGEGFDGYFVQPIQQGGLGFAIFNERFFPSRDLAGRENLFTDPQDMIARIGPLMREFSQDEERYRTLNAAWMETINPLIYDRENHCRRLSRLILGDFDFMPRNDLSRHPPTSAP